MMINYADIFISLFKNIHSLKRAKQVCEFLWIEKNEIIHFRPFNENDYKSGKME